jgi:hypothetical protein
MKAAMRTILMVVFMAGIAMPALAQTVACQVDDVTEPGSEVKVPVTVISGMSGGVGALPPVEFKGAEFSAFWQKGDRYETQTSFDMFFGDMRSTIYDFSPDQPHIGPINVMHKGNTRFQCWLRTR